MASVNERLRDEAVRHQIDTLRLRAGVLRRIVKLLQQADADLVSKLQSRLNDLSELDLERLKTTRTFSTERLRRLRKAINAIEANAKNILEGAMVEELSGIATGEAEYWKTALDRTFREEAVPLRVYTPPVAQLEAAVQSRPFQGRVLREHVKSWSMAKRAKMLQAIRLGVAEGEGIGGIARRMRQVTRISRKDAMSTARTAVTHVTQYARNKFAERNDDIIVDQMWVATLDGNTTPICISRDGKRVNRDLKGATPPAHYGCRSTTSFVTPSYRELGLDIDEVSDLTRAAFNGKVPQSQRFPAFFDNQTEKWQREFLGKWMFEEYKGGRHKITDFIDPSGKWYTRDEWLARNIQAAA